MQKCNSRDTCTPHANPSLSWTVTAVACSGAHFCLSQTIVPAVVHGTPGSKQSQHPQECAEFIARMDYRNIMITCVRAYSVCWCMHKRLQHVRLPFLWTTEMTHLTGRASTADLGQVYGRILGIHCSARAGSFRHLPLPDFCSQSTPVFPFGTGVTHASTANVQALSVKSEHLATPRRYGASIRPCNKGCTRPMDT